MSYPILFTTPGLRGFAEEIDAERQRQIQKFVEQHHPDGTGGSGALYVADRYRTIVDHALEAGNATWRDIALEEFYEALAESDPTRLRVELVQVAAVCAAWIADIDSRTPAEAQPAPAGQAPAPIPPEVISAILRDPGSPYFPAQITVVCDRVECAVEETADYMVRDDMTREERLGVARSHLVQAKGWRCTPEDGDLCPAHASTSTVAAACRKCRAPFDPADTRFDGRARHGLTDYCRHCVDLCHDNNAADHRCVICA